MLPTVETKFRVEIEGTKIEGQLFRRDGEKPPRLEVHFTNPSKNLDNNPSEKAALLRYFFMDILRFNGLKCKIESLKPTVLSYTPMAWEDEDPIGTAPLSHEQKTRIEDKAAEQVASVIGKTMVIMQTLHHEQNLSLKGAVKSYGVRFNQFKEKVPASEKVEKARYITLTKVEGMAAVARGLQKALDKKLFERGKSAPIDIVENIMDMMDAKQIAKTGLGENFSMPEHEMLAAIKQGVAHAFKKTNIPLPKSSETIAVTKKPIIENNTQMVAGQQFLISKDPDSLLFPIAKLILRELKNTQELGRGR